MKKHALVSLALLAMVSGKAFGHQIYYSDCDDSAEANAEAAERDVFDSATETNPDLDPIATGGMTGILGLSGQKNVKITDEENKCYSSDPVAKKLREENPEAPESDRLAALNFCKIGGYANPVDCASDVIAKNLVKEAKGCLDSFEQDVNEFNLTAHQTEGGGAAGRGIWHIDYRYSKEGGWHRHDWTPEAREQAGVLYAGAMIEQAKKRAEVNSRSDSEKGGTKVKVGATGEAGWFGWKAGVSTEGEGNKEKSSTTEKGPLTADKIKELEAKYKPIGEANPMRANIDPDMVCYKNEKTCSSSSPSGLVPNTSYQAAPSKKADDTPANKKDDSTQKKSSDNNGPAPKGPESSSFETPIEHKDHGTWAGEPSPTRPGEVWGDFSQEASESDTMANCLFQSAKDKVENESQKKYDQQGEDPRSDAEKKRDAEAALSKGLCEEQYFGKSYCANWRKKNELIKSDVQATDEKINQPKNGQPGKPGELHFIQPEPKVPKFDKDFLKNMPTDDGQPAGGKKIPGLKG